MAAITDAYATVPQYKAWTHKNDTKDDESIELGLEMTSRWWEERSGQFFTRDADVVTRLFRARYSDVLYLDYEGNCPGIAAVTELLPLTIKVDTDGDELFTDETAWAATAYRLLPLQADKGPLPRPWTMIEALTGSFAPGKLVAVTACFGWPAVPQFVRDGVKEWLAVWRGESIRTTARVNTLDDVETVSPYHLGQINQLLRISNARVTF